MERTVYSSGVSTDHRRGLDTVRSWLKEYFSPPATVWVSSLEATTLSPSTISVTMVTEASAEPLFSTSVLALTVAESLATLGEVRNTPPPAVVSDSMASVMYTGPVTVTYTSRYRPPKYWKSGLVLPGAKEVLGRVSSFTASTFSPSNFTLSEMSKANSV